MKSEGGGLRPSRAAYGTVVRQPGRARLGFCTTKRIPNDPKRLQYDFQTIPNETKRNQTNPHRLVSFGFVQFRLVSFGFVWFGKESQAEVRMERMG